MSSKKTDTEGVIYGVIGFGYIISAIVFTIWVMDFERIHPKLIFWGHLVFIGVPTFVVGWIAESFEKNETQIENEIGNLIDFQGKNNNIIVLKVDDNTNITVLKSYISSIHS